MTRDNLLFAIIGVLFGFIVGFLFASSMNQRYGPAAPVAQTSQMPGDHPPVGPNAGGPASGNMQAEVTASIEKARREPNNFEAQVKAAELYYQIQRYDPSIELLLKANQLRPDDYQTIVALGLVNLDAGHFDYDGAAEQNEELRAKVALFFTAGAEPHSNAQSAAPASPDRDRPSIPD